jgi:acetyl-CoA C-acetyltransferase
MSRTPVEIVGIGHTDYGSLDDDLVGLGGRAARRALDDAAMGPDDVEAAFVGNVGTPADPQQSILGQACLRRAGIDGVSITNVENACSSSACALHLAYRAVASGWEDAVMVLGVEKMTGISTEEAMEGLASAAAVRQETDRGLTFPSLYAMSKRAYEHRFGRSGVREALAAISVKNHANALDNPHAHLHREIDEEDVLSSPPVAGEMRLYDMCPNSDGAAAVVVASPDAHDRADPVTVEGSVHRTGHYDEGDFAVDASLAETAEAAYEQAGVVADEVDVFEVHDAATMGELQSYEALGLCEHGGASHLVEAGETERTGSSPVNPTGGLKARGHPIGATGAIQICDVVKQLRGEAGECQVEGASLGVAQNAGGALNGMAANKTVHVLRA